LCQHIPVVHPYALTQNLGLRGEGGGLVFAVEASHTANGVIASLPEWPQT